MLIVRDTEMTCNSKYRKWPFINSVVIFLCRPLIMDLVITFIPYLDQVKLQQLLDVVSELLEVT